MESVIVHRHLDTFFVSFERLENSELEKKNSDYRFVRRGVVASCYYETKIFGVCSAMPIKMSLSLCQEAAVI